MRFLRIAAAAFSVLAAPALWAQDPVVARVGSTVRVTAPSVSPQPLVGILDGANDSHLRLATSAGPTVIPRNAVERLQWSRGLHKPVLKRAVVGAVVLGAFGLVFGSAAHDPNENESLCGSKATCAAVGAGVGAVLGLIAGAVATPTHDWADVPGARRVSVVVRPRPRGVAAALAMGF
jgi:hypothetical protein